MPELTTLVNKIRSRSGFTKGEHKLIEVIKMNNNIAGSVQNY